MKVKVRCNNIRILFIRRVLNGAKIVNIHCLGANDNAAGVLTRGALYIDHSARNAHKFFLGGVYALLLIVFFCKTDSGLVGNGTDCTCFEHVSLAEKLTDIFVCRCLIFA